MILEGNTINDVQMSAENNLGERAKINATAASIIDDRPRKSIYMKNN